MIGDIADMLARLRSMVPPRWFNDAAPMRDALLNGLSATWSAVYDLIATVRTLARIATASGTFLDLVSTDFFGSALLRRSNEADEPFRLRIQQELLRPRATRGALVLALSQLTGRAPAIFEPARPADTGAYTVGGIGYGVAGGWGNLALPFQVFVTAFRPSGGGIAQLAGYGSGGVPVYGNLSLVIAGVSDADIAATVTATTPVASVSWLRIMD